jgi:hypothetical protein
MAGVRNGSGAQRRIPMRAATTAHRARRRGLAAAGLVAAAVVACALTALASNLAGSPGDGLPPAGGSYRPPAATGTYALQAGAVAAVERIPVRALIANARAQSGRDQVLPPERLPAAAPKLRSDGRPEIIFMCAEYWFKCAAERWPLEMALSKFGTFTALKGTTSSATGTSPRTPTFSFYGTTYSSKYLSVAFDEMETNTDVGGGEYPLLQPPSIPEMTLMSSWDRAPYTTVTASLPFAYIGGRFILTTAQFNASALSRMSFAAAASTVSAGTSTVAEDAQAAAGYLIADFCELTHGQPAPVCSAAP